MTDGHGHALNDEQAKVLNDSYRVAEISVHSMHLLHMKTVIIVMFIIIFVIGVSGNVYVVIINLKPRLENKVIAVYITNLALADILYISGTPFLAISSYQRNWLFGDFGCRLVYSLDMLTTHSSIYILVVMSIERYFAVANPLSTMSCSTVKYARLLCSVIWIFAACFALPMFIFTKQQQDSFDNVTVTYYCYHEWPKENIYRDYITTFFVLDYALPSIIIYIFYYKLIRKYWLRVVPSESGNEQTNRWKRKVASTLLKIVVVFWMCYTPFWIFTLAHLYSTLDIPPVVDAYLNLTVVCLTYANGCANPFLYTLMTQKKSKLRMMFMKCCKCRLTDTQVPSSVERLSHKQNGNLRPLTMVVGETNI